MASHSTSHTFTYKICATTSYTVTVHLPDSTKFSHVASLAAQILKQATSSGFGRTVPQAADVSDSRLPLIVYWHGGGLVSGGSGRNAWFPEWLLEDALNAGFCFLSADYSLFHPTDGYDLVDDVKDLFAWIENDLNTRLWAASTAQQQVDTRRITVAGSSAGGYLTYLSGLYATPKPVALLPIYAMGGNFLHSSYLCGHTEPFFFGNAPLHPSSAPFDSIINTPEDAAPVVSTGTDPAKHSRVGYYSYLLQTGTLNDALLSAPGISKQLKDSSGTSAEELVALLPSKAPSLYPNLLVGPSFPPTFLLHGTADTVVSIEESEGMEAILVKLGVEVQLRKVEGQEHGFDADPSAKRAPWRKGVVDWLLQKAQAV